MNYALIIPDPHSPVYLDSPNLDVEGKTLHLRFSLSNSPGISYKQFFGVVLPDNLPHTDLKFNSPIPGTTDTPKFDCNLTFNQGTTTRNITVTSTLGQNGILSNEESESNIIFCQLNDNTFLQMINGDDIIYDLAITLNQKLQSYFIQSVGLILSSTNTPDRIILDRIHNLGNIGQYNDYIDIDKHDYQPLIIENMSIIPVTGYCVQNGCSDIYPYDTFRLSIDLFVQVPIRLIYDHYIVIRYPMNIVKAESVVVTTNPVTSTSLTSLTESEQALNYDLKFNSKGLQINYGETNEELILLNADENLQAGRRFNLLFRGFTVLDNNTLVTNNIEVIVIWKNTFSVFSYDYKPIIQTKRITVEFPDNGIGLTGIHHPEFWDIYSNSAWPIKFNFKLNSSITYGGYVVIRHANAQSGVNSFNFIASTCDFSDTSSTVMSQALGERPICFPLRNDLDFSDSNLDNSTVYQGSGVFFYLKNIIQNTIYSVTIWGYAENCSSNESSSNNPTALNNRASYSVFKFIYTIYKDIKKYEIGEKRFTDQAIFAQSAPISMMSKCWNTSIGDSSLMFDFAMTKSAEWTEKLFYKEITDFKLGYSNVNNCTGCFLSDTSISFPNAYLYSSNDDTLLGKSFFLMNFDILMDKGIKNAGAYFPGPWFIENNEWNYIKGRLSIQFPRTWYEAGSTDCYLSWANTDSTSTSSYDQNVLLKNTSNDSNNYGNYISVQNNTIDSSLTNISSLTSDETGLIPNSIPKAFKITSIVNEPIYDGTKQAYLTGTTWSFLYDATKASSSTDSEITFNIFLYTNCVSTIFPRESSKTSIFSYLDIQVQWLSVTDNYPEGVVTKNIRMIKLYSELGVFNDPEKVVTNNSSNNTNIHYVFSSEASRGVCIVEISGSSLSQLYDEKNMDSIAIVLGFTILLESDYEDLTTYYPNNHLNTSISITGLSSSYSISNQNDYVKLTSSNLDTYFTGQSSYQWMLGSVIYLSNIDTQDITSSTDSVYNNLIIPIYCPFKDGIKSIGYSYPSIIVFSYISQKNFGYNSPVYKYMSNDDSSNTSNNYGYTIIFKKQGIPESNVRSTSTLVFDGYNTILNNDESNLYMHNGAIFSAGTQTNCDAMALFTSPLLNIISNPVFMYNTTPYALSYNNYEKFSYRIFGKSYQAFFSLISSSSLVINPSTLTTLENNITLPYSSNYYFTGIRRPNLSDVHSIRDHNRKENAYTSTIENPVNRLKSFNSLIDLAAFTCISNNSDKNYILTNLYRFSLFDIDTSINSPYFLVDFNLEETTGVNAPDFGLTPEFMSNYIYYYQDLGSNIITSFNSVGENFSGTTIRITSQQFNINTVCGLSNDFNVTYDCELSGESSDYSTIDCTTPWDTSAGATINICCYNIDMSVTTRENTFFIDSHEILFKNIYSSYFNSWFYISQDSNNSVSLTNPTSLSTVDPRISALAYYHVNQSGGYGKMQMKIDLQRDLPRNFVVRVIGNFSLFAIKNSYVNCQAYFFSNQNNGLPTSSANISTVSDLENADSTIEACYLGDLLNANNEIKVSIKNLILKCSLKINSILNILIWPVRQHDSKAYSFNEFDVIIELKDGTPLQEVEVTTYFNLPSLTNSANFRSDGVLYESAVDDSNNILKSISFFHNVSGFINTVKFQFDLTYIISNFTINKTTNNINEISFFLPLNTFEKTISNIVCKNQALVEFSCDYDEAGILNLSYPELYKEYSLSISIIGLTISNLNVLDIYIPYSINNLNSETGYRYNIINGIQKADLRSFSYNEIIGNILVQNSEIVYRVPREYSDLKFKFIFDDTQELIKYPISLSDAYVLINFPKYFYFNASNEKFPASVNIIKLNGNVETTVSMSIENHTETPIYGNLLYLTFTDTLIITSDIQYIEFNFENILNPSNAIANKEVTPIKIYIGSSSDNIGFVSNINLYNKSGDKLDSPINSYLAYTKGIQFKYLNTKLVLDFYRILDTGLLSTNFTLYPGRYFSYIFKISGNTTAFTSAQTTITLDNSYFQLLDSSYIVSTIYTTQNTIYLGSPCGTLPGNYIVNFSSSNVDEFFSLYPIRITLDISTTGNIKLSLKQNGNQITNNYITAKPGFAAYLFYTLSEYNVDPLEIIWTPTDATNSDSSNASISKGTIPKATLADSKSVFGTSEYTNSEKYNFKSVKPNSCFTFTNSTVTISFKELQPTSTKSQSSPALAYKFQYFNSITNTTLTEKNSLQFVFTSPTFDIFLFCALVCYESSYPSNIYNQTLTQNNLLQYYNSVIFSDTTTYINFGNLVRGWQYKLRCSASTTDFDYNNRMNNTLTLDLFSNFSYTNIPMVTEENEDSICVDLYFTQRPSTINATYLLDICQNIMVDDGFEDNGCFVCSDTENNLPNDYKYNIFDQCGSPFVEASSSSSRLLFGDEYNENYNDIFSRNKDNNNQGSCSGRRNKKRGSCLDEISKEEYQNVKLEFKDKMHIINKKLNDNSNILSNDTLEVFAINNKVLKKRNGNNIEEIEELYKFLSDSQRKLQDTTTSDVATDLSNDTAIEITTDTSTIEETPTDTASTETTDTATTDSSGTDTEVTYYRYSVCASQDRLCKTNLNTDNKLEELFDVFISNLTSIVNSNNNTISGFTRVGDVFYDNASITPKIDDIVISNLENSSNNNKLSWIATYPKYIRCYWLINKELETPPSVYSIKNCNTEDTSIIACSNQYINPNGVESAVILNSKLVPNLYNLWMYCVNDLPNSRITSNVGSAILIYVQQGENGGTITSTLEYSEKSSIDTGNTGIPVVNTSSGIIINVGLSILIFVLTLYVMN